MRPFVSITSANFWNSDSHFGLLLKNACTLYINFSLFLKSTVADRVLAAKFTQCTKQCILVMKGAHFVYSYLVTPVFYP
jgi:hypothetical protein